MKTIIALIILVGSFHVSLALCEPLWDAAETVRIIRSEKSPDKFMLCDKYGESIVNGVCGELGFIFRPGSGKPIEVDVQRIADQKIGIKYNLKVTVVGVLPVTYGRNEANIDMNKITILYKIDKIEQSR